MLERLSYEFNNVNNLSDVVKSNEFLETGNTPHPKTCFYDLKKDRLILKNRRDVTCNVSLHM